MNLSNEIYKLRMSRGLSREKFAEICGVSVQAVQKWESGVSMPDFPHIVQMTKYFDISIDELVYGRDLRKAEKQNSILPDYSKSLCDQEVYENALDVEYRQSIEEGLDLQMYSDVFIAAEKLPRNEVKKKIADALFLAVANAKLREDYPYREPNGYSEILQLRKGDFDLNKFPDKKTLFDKLYGAWTGRICGCMLGKTVEGIHTDELIPLLKETNNYPLHRYLKRADMTEEIYQKYRFPLRSRPFADETDGMPADDDTNYTILAQRLIERIGKDFTPSDVAKNWLISQPQNAYFTAEQIAYKNFVRGYNPPVSAIYQNPYREWIGAQIRGDYYGYIYAGHPAAAAEAAYRDASISHVKNGIYGEMFAAAMISAAAIENDIEKIIRDGLAQIPYTSRLYQAVSGIIENYKNGKSATTTFEKIHKEYDEFTTHGWCHTISNAMIVTAALLYGKGDYGKSICLAVETGFDTDCNGATVGSVLGMRNGYNGIGEEWKNPIRDTLYTSIVNLPAVSIKECAEKTLKHFNLCRE